MINLLKNSFNVLISWRFLLNLLIILVATSWIPLMSQTMVVRDGDGNVIQESTTTARLYESWWGVVTMKPGLNAHGQAVLWHLGICFVISFAVWFMTMRAWENSTVVTKQADGKEETPCAEE